MYLRKLELKDAPFMLSWMHDHTVTENLHTDFSSKTIIDAEEFINNSSECNNSVNLAIASDEDEYMGTVSLKNIENNYAEFAITIRSEAMRRGYSWFGMKSIIDKAFNEYALEKVYWCVSTENARAIRFYDKHDFRRTTDIPNELLKRYQDVPNLIWYEIRKGENIAEKSTVSGCKVIKIKTIQTEDSGELSFFEGNNDIPFDIKRIYYITNVPEGVRRGFHAHKTLKQLIFCPYGRIQLIIENDNGREEIELNDPSLGVIIDRFSWREMLWLQKDSVLCVAASDYYKIEDYVRDYDEFKDYIEKGVYK